MTDNITVTGVVGGDPRVHLTNQGLPITSFRLASTRRFFDREKGTWESGETNWYTVSTFRQLAKNAAVSIRRGDRVVVHGRLRLRAWESGEKRGTAIEIDADSVGHDLAWGTTSLTRNGAAGSTDAPASWATELGVDAGGSATPGPYGELGDAEGRDLASADEEDANDRDAARVPF